jgi:hypothetical protein
MGTVILVEYLYNPALSDAEYATEMARLRPCLMVREIELLQTFVAPDGVRALCVYRALDAEGVRYAHRSAGVAFHAAWPAHAR